MLAYDVTDARSFESLETWRDEFLIQAQPRDPERFPFVVLGNKVDETEGGAAAAATAAAAAAGGAAGTAAAAASGGGPKRPRAVTEKRARAWCASKGSLPHYDTSAKLDVNVEAAFAAVAAAALRNDDAAAAAAAAAAGGGGGGGGFGGGGGAYVPDTLDLGAGLDLGGQVGEGSGQRRPAQASACC